MPSDKYSGKNKEDLVLIATLGLVLTRKQANEMSREELAAYLYRKEQESAAEKKYNENIRNKEKKPLARMKTDKIKAKTQDDDQSGTEATVVARRPGRPAKIKDDTNPESKLSKKELNKLLFLQEVAKNAESNIILTEKATDSIESLQIPVLESVKDKSDMKATGDIPPVKAKRGRKPKIAAVIPEIPASPVIPLKAPKPAKPSKSSKPAKSAKSAKPSIPESDTVATAVKEEMPSAMKRRTRKKSEIIPEPEAVPETGTEAALPVQKAAEVQTEELTKEQTEAQTETENPADEKIANIKAETEVEAEVELETVEGALEIMPDGYGFLRKENYLQSPKDIYIPPQYIRRFNLKVGDWISGPGKVQRETDRYQGILYVKEVNGLPPEQMLKRPQFDKLTPIYPDVKFILETGRNELSTRIIDLIAPIGKGQRGMIVSPPKAGKTILLQKIANAIAINNPGTKLIVLLIDERPEEVTDMQRSINGEVVYSTFDKTPENHVKVVELVLERAMRLVELGQDVVILLDSITRLSRAYNLTINPTGRTLSGGLDPGALYGPKRFFGAARNIENGGSLTIIATSLIETGSRMDEVIFEEFKGTGNMEVYLDRKLSEKRIFPAIDINRSGTRREELLLTKRELDAVWTIRKAFSQLDTAAVTEMIINLLLKTNNNSHFVSSVNVSLNDKAVYEAMRGNKPGGAGNASANQSGNGNSNGNFNNYPGGNNN